MSGFVKGGAMAGKAKRKPRPSIPHWAWGNRDGCWLCKNRNNCNQCKENRKLAKGSKQKKYKGEYMKMDGW